jgi:hypothetical protein
LHVLHPGEQSLMPERRAFGTRWEVAGVATAG